MIVVDDQPIRTGAEEAMTALGIEDGAVPFLREVMKLKAPIAGGLPTGSTPTRPALCSVATVEVLNGLPLAATVAPLHLGQFG